MEKQKTINQKLNQNSPAGKDMPTKILLVEDHEIVRKGIRSLLDDNVNITVIGEASNGAEAVEKVESITPDVILMDMNMPVMNGLECTKHIKKTHPDIKILVLSMHDHEDYLLDMIEAGADGYILKNTSKEELVFAIKKVANHDAYLSSAFTKSILSRIRLEKKNAEPISSTQLDLSDKEIDVLKLVAEGLTNGEIADKLYTSIRTIETRRKRLLEKTNTTNTATLIHFAVKNGLI